MSFRYEIPRPTIKMLVTFLLFFSSTFTWAAEQPTKVGVILPLTGELALYGEKVLRGIELVTIEYQGDFDLIIEDSTSSPVKAVTAFQKLSSIDKVKFIIGPAGPDETLAVAPLAERQGVTLIAISLCDPRFKPYAILFCTYPAIREQVSPLFAEFSARKKLVSSMAVLVEESEIGNSYFDLLSAFANESGIRLVFAEKYLANTADYRPFLLRVRQKNPELLVMSSPHPESILRAYQQARQLGFNPKYRWYLSEYDKELFAKHKELLEGVYMEAIPSDFALEFISLFQKKYGVAPDLYSAMGYDAAKNLLSALNTLGAASFDKLSKYLVTHQLSSSAIRGFRFHEDHTVGMELTPSRFLSGEQKRIR